MIFLEWPITEGEFNQGLETEEWWDTNGERFVHGLYDATSKVQPVSFSELIEGLIKVRLAPKKKGRGGQKV